MDMTEKLASIIMLAIIILGAFTLLSISKPKIEEHQGWTGIKVHKVNYSSGGGVVW